MIDNNEVLKNYINSRLSETEVTTVSVPIIKQKRRNKNKRINKKWLKKYGYTVLHKQVKGKVLKINSEDYPKGLFSPDTEITFCLK